MIADDGGAVSTRRVVNLNDHRLVLADSITETIEDDAGAIVVTGSHGGKSAASYAARIHALLYVFNDAGIGVDEAGVAGLGALDVNGIAAVAVSHESARIGDAADTLSRGTVSRTNRNAEIAGLRKGEPLADALFRVYGIAV